MDILISQQWGNYRLVRLLGRGGFAEVYLGEHVSPGGMITATPGEPRQNVTVGSTRSTTNRNAPTPQPSTASTTASTPSAVQTSTAAAQATPTAVPDCINGSINNLTITQALGATVTLPGAAVTLTNCSPVAGHWTATSQIDNGSGWTSCNPNSGDIPANGTQTVHIVMDSPAVLLGAYTAQWIFTMGHASWTVHVTLIVIA